jgi:DNA-binding transcriptional LysR family regulator
LSCFRAPTSNVRLREIPVIRSWHKCLPALHHCKRSAVQWSDVQVFLAVVRAGTVRGAASAMKLDASTVSRRVAALERSARVRLFERTGAGLILTSAGRAMLDSSERVHAELERLERLMVGHDDQLGGVVRVTLPGSLSALVHRAVAPFIRAHKDIEIELLTLDAMVDVDGKQADVALRVAAEPAEHLVGRRVGALAGAIYGSREYLRRHDATVEAAHHTWVDWDRRLASKPAFAWLRERVPGRRIAARGLSTADVLQAIVAGVGLGALPCVVGDAEPSLVRLLDAPRATWTSVWLLTHADLKPAARVRAVIAHLGAALRAERPRIEGRREAIPHS